MLALTNPLPICWDSHWSRVHREQAGIVWTLSARLVWGPRICGATEMAANWALKAVSALTYRIRLPLVNAV